MIMENAKFDWFCETDDEKQTLLLLAVDNLIPKWVEFFLKKGLDPNITWSEYRRYSNSLQYMLYNHRYMKNEKFLGDLTHIVKILVDSGIDLEYTDSDGRNVIDYLHRYGWYRTEACNIIKEATDEKVTGNVPSKDKYESNWNIKNVDRDSMSPVMKILFDNRYEKDRVQLKSIVDDED